MIKYYADYHDVDEDSRTVILRGGYWEMIGKVGVTQQNMYDTPDRVYASVASRCRHLKKISNYMDYHDVDEGIAAISLQGGIRVSRDVVGITCRSMFHTSAEYHELVASSNMENSATIRIGMVSTKICSLLLITVEYGLIILRQVLCIEIWRAILSHLPTLLLRRTSKIDQILYG